MPSAILDTGWQQRSKLIKLFKRFLGKNCTVLFIDPLLWCSVLQKSQHLKDSLQKRNQEVTLNTGQTAHGQWKDDGAFLSKVLLRRQF